MTYETKITEFKGFKATKQQLNAIEDFKYLSFYSRLTSIVNGKYLKLEIIQMHDDTLYMSSSFINRKGNLENPYFMTIKPNGYVLKNESKLNNYLNV